VALLARPATGDKNIFCFWMQQRHVGAQGCLLAATVKPKDMSDLTLVPLDDLMAEVAALIVEALNLEVQAHEVSPDAPLYGDGLGLDSIDMLEISLVISKRYGLQLRSDNENNGQIYSSLRALTQYVASQRTK
jgi:acyl carrier protein